MPSRNRTRRTVRASRRRQLPSIIGTAQPLLMSQLLSHQVLSTTSAGLNTTIYTYAQLTTDINTSALRTIHLNRIILTMWPSNEASTPGAGFAVQICAVDPVSLVVVPISAVVPVSSVNKVIVKAKFPFAYSWQPNTSSVNALQILVYSRAALASGIIGDIRIWYEVSRDTLS
jgi:hypothetical protein